MAPPFVVFRKTPAGDPKPIPCVAAFSPPCGRHSVRRGRPFVGPKGRPRVRLAPLRPAPAFRRLRVPPARQARRHAPPVRPARLHAPASRLHAGRRAQPARRAWLLLPPDAGRPPDRPARVPRGISPASLFLPAWHRLAAAEDRGTASVSSVTRLLLLKDGFGQRTPIGLCACTQWG